MFNLDPAKLLVIGIVAIILLGPDKLPQVAKQAGAAWRHFNEFRHRMESEVRNTMPDLPPTSEIARLARSPSALLNHLSTLSSDADGDAAPDPSADPDEVPDGAFQPPGDLGGGAAGYGAVGTNGAEGANHVTQRDGGSVTPTVPVAGAPSRPADRSAPSPTPTAPAAQAPEVSEASQVIVPGDPTLN